MVKTNKIKQFFHNIPFWVRLILSFVYIFIGCCAWGFASSDYLFNELSKHTQKVGVYDVNLGVAWMYAHLSIMFGMVIALFVTFGVLIISWCIRGKSHEH